jgi:hypothetical protein
MRRFVFWLGIGSLLVVLLTATFWKQVSGHEVAKFRESFSTLTSRVLHDQTKHTKLLELLANRNFSKQLKVPNLSSCSKKGKWGFMDLEGQLVIPQCFDEVRSFSNGVAQVGLKDDLGDLQYGYIDRNGVFMIPPILNEEQFISSSGFNNSSGGSVISDFSNDLLPLRQGLKGKIGYFDKTAKFAIAPQFDRATSFNEGLAQVCFCKGGNCLSGGATRQCGYIDSPGKFVITPKLGLGTSFQDGVAIFSPNSLDIGFKLIDQKGQEVVSDVLTAVGDYQLYNNFSDKWQFQSDLLPVRAEGNWGYIRRTGGYGITPRFNRAYSFSQDRAVVKIGNDDTNYGSEWRGRWALIDTSGHIVDTRKQNNLEPQLESIVTGGRQFSEEVILVKASNDRYGYIDQDGQWVIEPKFLDAEDFSHGLAPIRSDLEKWGYIDHAGAVVIPPQFDRAETFISPGLAKVQVNKEHGVINLKGEYILEPIYRYIKILPDGIIKADLLDKDAPSINPEIIKTDSFFFTKTGKILPYARGLPEVSEGLIAVSKQLLEEY